jgi:hypothetical protein
MTPMQKIWFIQINGKKEGPYRALDLKRDPRITPDTLVWKQGWTDWKPLRDIPELQEIFEDEETDEEAKPKKIKDPLVSENDVLTLKYDPPNLYLWLLLVFIVIFAILFYIY